MSNYKSSAELYDVSGWVVVGSGCGSGLGLHMAKSLAASGARVYIASRRRQVLDKIAAEHTGPGEIIPLTLDHSDKESLKAAVAEVSKREKYIDLFIANAAVVRMTLVTPQPKGELNPEQYAQALFDQPTEDWDELLRINLSAVYFSSVAFMPLLAANPHKERASIVTIGSISGTTALSQGGQYAYNVSKAGLHSLTRMLANDFKHPSIGVRVNCLAPGFFPSEMTIVQGDEEEWKKIKHIRERLGDQDDIASALYALCTNRYMNGVILHVDGGWLVDNP
ncbi:NAD(P)-binding protein [Serendipita vermifera]|nr:NAD(P)-binding protein [Serendipita vermifera]